MGGKGISDAGEHWRHQHQILLFQSRMECLPRTQWSLQSQDERNFRNPSSDDLKILITRVVSVAPSTVQYAIAKALGHRSFQDHVLI